MSWVRIPPGAPPAILGFWNRNFLLNFAPVLTLEHLAELLAAHHDAAKARVADFAIGGKPFAFNHARPAIMGVINLSPDSWYRESVCLDATSAIQRGQVLAAQGAAIVDVGVESTLAHAARVDELNQNS